MSEAARNPPKKRDVLQKGPQMKHFSGNQSKLRKKTKKKSNSVSSRTSHFNPEDAEQRDNEINQCFHVLGNRSMKLFKKGTAVTSYGLNLDVRLPEKVAVKLILNVPHEYPKSPLQLQWKKSSSGDNLPREITFQTLVRNFNFKARDMSLQKIPMIAQLNYLVYKAENLAASGFKLIDRREREFFAAFG
ncbi:hypothetical protein HG536_0C00220 [Torulaspora globosa]|uniref:Uncharacterized protein n=1 Tax=Torulaspora globosa TaxID=48254 RepID=A0A7G3ZEB9_9SACH|nr:uncharacterized protein HG536_0C00220 [Torulaspora globosa]QLL31855.1 hypothetical protein HG536_0C00220 [Torulaspora globosa]